METIDTNFIGVLAIALVAVFVALWVMDGMKKEQDSIEEKIDRLSLNIGRMSQKVDSMSNKLADAHESGEELINRMRNIIAIYPDEPSEDLDGTDIPKFFRRGE